VRTIEPTTIRDLLRGARVLGPIAIPNADTGILFDNGLVLDLLNHTILTLDASTEVVARARITLDRQAAQLSTLSPLEAVPEPEPEADEYALEVPDFIPSVPLLDADADERDVARGRRIAASIDIEEGWVE